jgi:hypothetical protein
VAAGGHISYSGFSSTGPGGITWSAANPTVLSVANAGYYQVTYGVSIVTGSSGAPLFSLDWGESATVSIPSRVEPVIGSGMISMTAIIQLPSTASLRVQNVSVSGSDLINDVFASGKSPAAYITIIRLQ